MKKFTNRITIMAGVGLFASAAIAGGPLYLDPTQADGQERWPNGGADIPYNIDNYSVDPTELALGTWDHNQAVAEIQAALNRWESIPTATQTYQDNGFAPVNYTTANYFPLVGNLFFGTNTSDGLSPVVMDQDGSIFVDLFGFSGVLGFASVDTRAPDGTPIEAVAFLNGGALAGNFPFGTPVAEDDFRGMIFHEFGHYTGLAHTVCNGQNVLLGDDSGPGESTTFGNSPLNQVETMYPFIVDGGDQKTPHADDIGVVSTLYPAAGYAASSGRITGTILDRDGVSPLSGVNVIARNLSDPFADAVSSISGDQGTAGVYTLRGLTPGADYAIFTDQILAGGFSTAPITLPAVEEYYNGADESNNEVDADPPLDYEAVTAIAGEISGIDIIMNGIREGDPIPLGDDDFEEIPLGFSYEICGQEFTSVFINSNGSLTFGAGSTDFSESVSDFLGGPPRVAGLWDDLNPSAGGTVTFYRTPNSFRAEFIDVPEFFASTTNTFTIEVQGQADVDKKKKEGAQATVTWGDIAASDGLAGVSCGGAVTSGFEVEEALRESGTRRNININKSAASYELFSGGDNDLDNYEVRWVNVNQMFEDGNEPNNTLADATPIDIPYNSGVDYIAIDPVGNDVDYYVFSATANTTLIAEVLSGSLDSVLGVFDDSGTLLDSDDDGGSGLLSRLVYPIAADGTYAVAVSTFNDFDFDGDGGSGGRYTLDVQLVSGILLDLGDDDNHELTLPFSFPFQGSSYGSVFVNSNGNLTFGSGDNDFSDTVSELLNDQPRIAALWDDLSPNQGGQVIAEFGTTSVSVEFQNVPEFLSGNSNNFVVTLYDTGVIDIAYGNVDTDDVIIGISPGGGAADPGEVDLSTSASWPNLGVTYEAFSFEAVDVENTTLTFE